MTLQNRVTPLGEIAALPARGSMMGNRGGRIHDPASQTLRGRPWASRQWICCVLDFKARRRPVMGPGYTELFFLDEVSALAAGHRPCFECRRKEAIAFATAFGAAHRLDEPPRAAAMDMILHAQRLTGRAKRLHAIDAELPDGAMIVTGEKIAVRKGANWLRWMPDGYLSMQAPDLTRAHLITPPAIVGVLRAGYAPRWHETALAY